MSVFEPLLNLLRQFVPPDFSLDYLKALRGPVGETVEMAAGGILIALIVGTISGVWAGAKLPFGRVVYGLLAAVRSIPDLTLAIFCVVVVGLGPAAGMLALAIFYSAAIGKIFSDLFLSADPGPVYALRAVGASRFSVALFGLIPLRLQDILSYGAYEFESAVRASVIVGAVGGGGLGTELVGTINALDYRRVTTLLVCLVALIALIDLFARLLKNKPIILTVVLPLCALAFWQFRPQARSFSHAASTFAGMLPPSLPPDAVASLPRLFWETLEIALGGTAFAILAALPLGLCATRNLAPPLLSLSARRSLEALRAVPEVVWGLIFVSLIGVGPKAGVVALALHTTGSLGRLYAESFENIPKEVVQALAATGAPKLALAGFAFIPLALGPLTVHSFFRLEWNIRAATILGVIGAGGIGQALFNAQQLFFYKQMTAYLVITWLLVLSVDTVSSITRRRMRLMEMYI